jgi:hypothetical protein
VSHVTDASCHGRACHMSRTRRVTDAPRGPHVCDYLGGAKVVDLPLVVSQAALFDDLSVNSKGEHQQVHPHPGVHAEEAEPQAVDPGGVVGQLRTRGEGGGLRKWM